MGSGNWTRMGFEELTELEYVPRSGRVQTAMDFGFGAGSPRGELNGAGTGGWAGDATAPSGLRNAANRLPPGR